MARALVTVQTYQAFARGSLWSEPLSARPCSLSSIPVLEEDADSLLVNEALNKVNTKHITVSADDTDILLLLLHHSSKNSLVQSATQQIHFMSSRSFRNLVIQGKYPTIWGWQWVVINFSRYQRN